MAKFPSKEREATLLYQREWYKKNKKYVDKKHKEYRIKNRAKLNKYSRLWSKNNKVKNRQIKKDYTDKIKLEVFQYYSKAKIPFCACPSCKIKIFRFLTIDHINGGGNKHRKRIKGTMYNWLIKKKFPAGYCVLCYNCNFSKKTGNMCLGHNERIK